MLALDIQKVWRQLLRAAMAATTLLTLQVAAAPVVSVQLDRNTGDVGQRFVAEVKVAAAVDLYAFEFDLMFDPAVLRAHSVQVGTFLDRAGPSIFLPGSIDNSLGLVAFTGGSLLGAIAGGDGDGLLARFEFDAVGVGSSLLELSNGSLFDSSLALVQAGFLGASIRVNAGGPTPPVISSPVSLSLVLLPLAYLLWSKSRRRDGAAPSPP